MGATRVLATLAVTSGLALAAAACGSAGAPASTPGHSAGTPPPSAAASTAPAGPAAATPPPIVAVTSHGALVTLDPATGVVTRRLGPTHVLGDEISVSGAGMVYFAVQHHCTSTVEEISADGGTPAVVAENGSLPAVSPDGTKLAYARQLPLVSGCIVNPVNLSSHYKVVVRSLSTGGEVIYPMVPAGQGSGLPFPIGHLSWAPDNERLAVSTTQVQDNEGWGLHLVDTATARDVMSGPGTTVVPVTGQPDAGRSYLREGVFMPDGDLFVSRACCAGVPVVNNSRLMWEVTTSGALVHQVAIGYASLDHTSLNVSADGQWLLYLAGTVLYVSHGGARPRAVTSGLIAAAWG